MLGLEIWQLEKVIKTTFLKARDLIKRKLRRTSNLRSLIPTEVSLIGDILLLGTAF